jgi:hypothetical protein
MKLIYRKKAIEAGGEASIEPSTYKLLEEQFPADILRLDLAFPKYASKEAKKTAIQMQSLLMKWVQTNQTLKPKIYQDMIKLAKGGVDRKGLRIDARVKIPGCPEIWVDHGNTHATKMSSFNSTYNFAIKVHKTAENSNGALGTSNVCFHQSTPALDTMRKS